MTPLETLVQEHIAAARERAWYAEATWERKARAEIAAMVESRNRGMGQLFRHAARRLREKFRGEYKS
jgi:hypothetical protein